MHRSHSIPGVFALAASLFAVFAAAATPVHAVENVPDARILSAAPFVYQGDRGIFSRMPVEPSDSRILKPIAPIQDASDFRVPQDRFKRQSAI
ncbi:hypothetical protein AWB77_05640 [Caballeronia fortuita]|uniref:Hydrolase n=1 Tax=Caballeronia fortuita TaxID=1777138 RepID=A0A158DSI4_9BURK|nr:hypothetical protein [Caballeronia fortuita]SAK96687.1 hypothetical protein AWB77_05640 [Caballeronia fortuita]